MRSPVADTLAGLWKWCRADAPGRRRWVAFSALLLLCALSYTVHRALHLHSCDLRDGFLIPSRGVLFEGKDPFVDYRFNSYSPFFYVAMAPFAALPDTLASLLWSVMLIGCLVSVIGHLRGILIETGQDPALVRPWVAPVLALPFLLDNLFLGQSNLVVLAFTCAALHALVSKRPFRGGLLLSVAIALKLTPALFLLYAVLKREGKVLVGAAVGLGVLLVVVPSFAYGPVRNATLLQEWSQFVIQPFVRGEKLQTTSVSWYHTNQSLDAFLNRSLTSYGRDNYGGLHTLTDPASLEEAQVRRVGLVLKLLVVAVLAAAALKERSVNSPRFLLEVGLYFLGILFLSPASWFNHYVAVLVPYAAAAQWLAGRRRDLLLRYGLGLAVFLSFVCFTPQARSYSPIFLSQLVLFLGLTRRALSPSPLAAARPN